MPFSFLYVVCIPELLIKASLIGMLILAGAMMVVSFLYSNFIGGILGAIFFAIFICYARAGKRGLLKSHLLHIILGPNFFSPSKSGLVFHLPVSTCLLHALL